MKSQKILIALAVVILLVNVAVGGALIWETKKQTKLIQANTHLIKIGTYDSNTPNITRMEEINLILDDLEEQDLYDPFMETKLRMKDPTFAKEVEEYAETVKKDIEEILNEK